MGGDRLHDQPYHTGGRSSTRLHRVYNRILTSTTPYYHRDRLTFAGGTEVVDETYSYYSDPLWIVNTPDTPSTRTGAACCAPASAHGSRPA